MMFSKGLIVLGCLITFCFLQVLAAAASGVKAAEQPQARRNNRLLFDLEVGMADGSRVRVLEKGTPLPTQRNFTFMNCATNNVDRNLVKFGLYNLGTAVDIITMLLAANFEVGLNDITYDVGFTMNDNSDLTLDATSRSIDMSITMLLKDINGDLSHRRPNIGSLLKGADEKYRDAVNADGGDEHQRPASRLCLPPVKFCESS